MVGGRGKQSMGCMQKAWGGPSCLKLGDMGEGGGAQITGRWSFALFTAGPDGEFQHASSAKPRV